MRAVVIRELNAPLTVENVEALPPLPSQVVVKIEACGVCHSDLHMAEGQYGMLPVPIIAGHEGAGTVVEVGSAVRRLKPGDKVIAAFWSACGECFYCTQQQSYLCDSPEANTPFERGSIAGKPLPPTASFGAMAEYMTAHEDFLVKVETDLPFDQLALIGCGVTTGLGSSLWAARIQPGSSVVVFGAGGVGVAAIQGAKIAGASEIIVVDPVVAKKDMVMSFGATHYVNPRQADAVEQIRALTKGRGADYSLEVVGNLDVMHQAYFAARPGGTVCYVGGVKSDLKLNLPANEIHRVGKTIIGSSYGSALVRRDFAKIVRLAETGRLDLEGMISRRYPLEGINDAFAAMKAGEVVRSVVIP